MIKSKKFQIIIYYVINMSIFILIGYYFADMFWEYDNFSLVLFAAVLLIGVLYFISIIFHELGHLVFGLLSGYKFSSFRIFNTMILKKANKYELKKFSLAGTAGQCIMIPPKGKNVPFVLYNLGGIIINLLLILISTLLFFLVDSIYVKSVLFICGMLNFSIFLSNGLPLDIGVPNDMWNIIEFKRNKKSYQQFLNSLYLQDLTIKGVRPKDISSEYIFKPKKLESIGDVNNIVSYCGKLMDNHEFNEAIEEINNVLDNSHLVLIYKALLLNDLKFCYIVLNKDLTDIEFLFDYQVNNVLRQMADYPSVLRTNYAYSLLVEKNELKSSKLLNLFNKLEKTYPYLGDYLSEKDLISIVNNKSKEK